MIIRSLCISTLAYAAFVFLGTDARAQACKPGVRVNGTAFIERARPNEDGLLIFADKPVSCGITIILVPPRLIRSPSASGCKVGVSTLVFSGKTERFDDQPDKLFVRADSARC